jgi:hypothetical protein
MLPLLWTLKTNHFFFSSFAPSGLFCTFALALQLLPEAKKRGRQEDKKLASLACVVASLKQATTTRKGRQRLIIYLSFALP